MEREVPERLCRTCGQTGDIYSVFDSKNDLRLCDLISQHLTLTISTNDTFSTYVCLSCEEKLMNFHEYYLMCKRVQHWFSQCDISLEEKKNIEEIETVFNESIFVAEGSIDSNEINDIKIENNYYNDSLSADIAADLIDANTPPDHDYSEESNGIVLKTDLDAEERETCENKLKKKNVFNKKHKKDFQINCSECDLNCRNWNVLTKHSKSEHGTSPSVKCTLCQAVICSKTVLYMHMTQHKNPIVFQCDLCQKIMNTFESLQKHKERHVPKSKKIFHCDICNKTLKTKHGLEKHRTIHTPIEQRQIFSCDICNMKFTTARTVTQHKKVVHDKIKCSMCDLCGYTCATKFELQQHWSVHTNLKLFECSICLKRVKTESSLRTHMDTHEGTSYTCEICYKVLNTRRTFRKHKLVHEGARTFTCSYCNISFKRKQSLQIHMNSHTGDKPISCKWCDEKFMYWASLRIHKQRNHPDKLMTK